MTLGTNTPLNDETKSALKPLLLPILVSFLAVLLIK